MAPLIIRLLFGRNTSRDQRLRIRRFLMSLSSYTMWYLIAWLCLEFGLIRIAPSVMGFIGLVLLASQLVFYFLIRFNLNLRFDDPSMTMAQIIIALLWCFILIAAAREIRGVLLTVFMVTLLFGIFALNKRQFMIVALMAFVGYTGLVLVEQVTDPGLFSDGYYMLSVMIFGGVLLWTTLFGSYVSNLRYKLSARNEELQEALERIQELADHDDLTGLYNRRYIMESLRREIARHKRHDSTFSVILIDLDNFKEVNDNFGHSAGDRLLREFGRCTEKALRGMDIVGSTNGAETEFARYGGEEFIVILPDTGIEGALQAAERLRSQQEQLLQQHRTVPHVTLSAGVAEYVAGESIESLLRRVDHALYEAKHGGRNRVCDAKP